jgi:hypothetical protein
VYEYIVQHPGICTGLTICINIRFCSRINLMFSINCKLSCGSVSDVLRARTAHDHAWNALLRESASTNHGCLRWCDACKPVGGITSTTKIQLPLRNTRWPSTSYRKPRWIPRLTYNDRGELRWPRIERCLYMIFSYTSNIDIQYQPL